MTSRRENSEARSRLFQAEAEWDVSYLLARLRDPRDRFMTVKFLGELKAPEAVPALIPLLRAGDRRVRSSAAEALATIGATEAVPELIDRALVETDVVPRTWAIMALGRLGDERALEPLCMLLSDEDVLVRESAANALGVLGHPAAIEPLCAAAAKERWVDRKRHRQAIKKLRAPASTRTPSGESSRALLVSVIWPQRLWARRLLFFAWVGTAVLFISVVGWPAWLVLIGYLVGVMIHTLVDLILNPRLHQPKRKAELSPDDNAD